MWAANCFLHPPDYTTERGVDDYAIERNTYLAPTGAAMCGYRNSKATDNFIRRWLRWSPGSGVREGDALLIQRRHEGVRGALCHVHGRPSAVDRQDRGLGEVGAAPLGWPPG